ncbi:MAG: restriction endonuclease subunit S [Bacteroidales bacterium]|nr:restriction endonuclease subunit S [Bacteroidales bacterium]
MSKNNYLSGKITPLKWLLRIGSGDSIDMKNVSQNKELEKEVPVVGGNGIMGYTELSNTGANTLVVGRVGAHCGNIHFIKENSWVTDNALKIRLTTDLLDKTFLKYSLTALELNQFANRNAQPLITGETVKSKTILLTSLSEQTQIAKFLDHKTGQIDRLIEQKENLLKLLAEKRTAIITQAVTKGLHPNVETKDSGIDWLGEIPKHWGVKRFKFCLKEPLKYGANEAAESSDPEQPRFVRITDVDENGNLREETFRSIDSEIAKPFLLEEGDLLMARSGATVGKNFMYKSNWGIACFAGYLIRARINQEIMLPEFGNLFLNSGSYWDWVNSIFIQSTIQNISAEKYANLVLPVPPKEEQKEIVEFAARKRQQLGSVITEIAKSLDKLKEYREALITAAVTGQIKV